MIKMGVFIENFEVSYHFGFKMYFQNFAHMVQEVITFKVKFFS